MSLRFSIGEILTDNSESFGQARKIMRERGLTNTGNVFAMVLLRKQRDNLEMEHFSKDRRDSYWLYVVTHCKSALSVREPIKNPARFPWHEEKKANHYYLSVDALTQSTQIRQKSAPYTS
jgi:hypothetical protein